MTVWEGGGGHAQARWEGGPVHRPGERLIRVNRTGHLRCGVVFVVHCGGRYCTSNHTRGTLPITNKLAREEQESEEAVQRGILYLFGTIVWP